ncbi:hypothetical protein GXW82_30285 [Streptacidiphilus sp. 4-A2]|nr:hypothetical protein [Streptacidiphilus sp. 4-A2]
MTLSADGRTLYVALQDAHAIAAIDTTTLAETARYPVPGGLGPSSVAVTGGELWFSYWGAHPSDPSGIGSVDVAAAQPAVAVDPAQDDWQSAPLLAVSPGAPGTLAAGDWNGVGESSVIPKVAVFQVSQGTLVSTAVLNKFVGLTDLAVTPDGKELVVATDPPGSAFAQPDPQVYSLADLSLLGHYGETGTEVNGVAIAPQGTVAASVAGIPEVSVYPSGGIGASNSFSFAAGTVPADRGLAWGANGTELFAVTQDIRNGTNPVLHIMLDPEQAPTTARLVAPAAVRGTAFTIKGRLQAGGVPAIDPGAVVTVTRTDSATGRTVALPAAKVGFYGTFSVTDQVAVAGSYTYQAGFAGDPEHTPATASVTVDVARTATPLTLGSNAPTYAYGATATVTAHLGATTGDRTVSIYAQPSGGAKVLVRTGAVDARGDLSTGYRVTGATTLTAVFAGDAGYDAPATATAAVQGYAGVQQTLAGSYGSASYGHVLYRLYHRTAKPVLTATVLPDKAGQCVVFQLQKYSAGSWRAVATTGCAKLNSASSAVLRLPGGYPVGGLYRVDTEYLRSAADHTELDTTGAWQYFAVRA